MAEWDERLSALEALSEASARLVEAGKRGREGGAQPNPKAAPLDDPPTDRP
jgi:hypothetical protein